MAFEFNTEQEKRFQWLVTRFPKKDATLIPVLHVVQAQLGHLSMEAVEYVAKRVEISPARVREVASFYTMFRFKPNGRYILQVCHNLSCYLRGSDDLITHLKKSLGISEGETTPDGLFTIERVECLASCGTAPVIQVNEWDFHEELNIEKLDQVIQALRQHKWAKPAFTERTQEGSVA